jgi:hypothetical protein
MAFRRYSDDLEEGALLPQAPVFSRVGHSGGNLSPHLAWPQPLAI